MTRRAHGDKIASLDESTSTCLGACDPGELVEVTCLLRRQHADAFGKLLDALARDVPEARPLSREAYAQTYAASHTDLDRIHEFAHRHHLQIRRAEPAENAVTLAGTVARIEAAFGVKLQHFEHPGLGRYRSYSGSIALPDDVHELVSAVLGLDDRSLARPHFRVRPPLSPADQATQSYTPDRVASLYGFPAGTGVGQCIALIELGGGYRQADLDQYFGALNLPAQPVVVAVNVGSGSNAPSGDANGPDGEVALDIEVAGAIAPGATLAVYFAPNTDAGFLQAVNQAIHDTTHRPSVISISWGGPEARWTQQSMQAFDQVLQTAAALGVTICAASGDSGSSDGIDDGANHVDFPASSPHVLACGGTRLGSGKTLVESVWDDLAAGGGASGGGQSSAFAVPTWQASLSLTLTGGGTTVLQGRGVPDVAGDASPESGYEVTVDGTSTVIGGTSAVAPLWAALIARINALAGAPVGWINPKLYGAPQALRDIVSGNNGAYAAAVGWDACTGLGSPDGAKLAALLQAHA
jgi:kumamolisin